MPIASIDGGCLHLLDGRVDGQYSTSARQLRKRGKGYGCGDTEAGTHRRKPSKECSGEAIASYSFPAGMKRRHRLAFARFGAQNLGAHNVEIFLPIREAKEWFLTLNDWPGWVSNTAVINSGSPALSCRRASAFNASNRFPNEHSNAGLPSSTVSVIDDWQLTLNDWPGKVSSTAGEKLWKSCRQLSTSERASLSAPSSALRLRRPPLGPTAAPACTRFFWALGS